MKLPKRRVNKVAVTMWTLLLVALAAGASVVIDSQLKDDAAPVKQIPLTDLQVKQAPKPAATPTLPEVSETPVQITIDAIGVDAEIITVGLTSDGLMDAPNSNELVGWYDKSSPAGGTEFAMLLDGHYGTKEQPAVFHRLADLKVGDVITIKGADGTVLEYRLVETKQQEVEDVDMKKALYPYRDGVQSLTIITCEGLYDPINATYDMRTIVYAERTA